MSEKDKSVLELMEQHVKNIPQTENYDDCYKYADDIKKWYRELVARTQALAEISLAKELSLRKLAEFWRTDIVPVDHQVENPYYFTLSSFPREVKEAVEKILGSLLGGGKS